MQRPDEKKANKEWNWSSYFAAKKQKLEQQYQQDRNEISDLSEDSKNLFRNIGIFVNGYTNPTAIELKILMTRHGGVLYEYMNDKVNYIVASNLAHSKALALKNKLVIKPEWILDCIKEQKLLAIDAYLLVTSAHDKAQNKLTDYMSNKKILNDEECLKPKDKSLKRKSYEPVLIDISRSPTRSSYLCKNKEFLSLEKRKYLQDFLNFESRIKRFESSRGLKMNGIDHDEVEIDCIKSLLSDWIVWTSNKNKNEINNSHFGRNNQQQIDNDDLQIFKNYLFYLLKVNKNFEKLSIIFKILKRLILKEGSFEWAETYRDLSSSIQTEFYEQYDSTLNLD